MAEFGMKVKEKENHTGIPTRLKERMEQSTGLSFDDVRVNYNSSLPARLDALAYTKGNQIEIGPGQERHLPHELGHVVQQKLGIVRANARHSTGVAMNTDAGLEHQADEIGAGKKIGISRGMGVNVVQRRPGTQKSQDRKNKVWDFFGNMRTTGALNLNVYTYIYSDGLGDAGQLKLLYDKVISKKKELNIWRDVNMLCTYDISPDLYERKYHKEYTVASALPVEMAELKADRRRDIQNICGNECMVMDNNLKQQNIRKSAFGHLRNHDWEIEYPVPDQTFEPDNPQILKIKEMGFELNDMIKAGDTENDGIGYGVPDTLRQLPANNDQSAETFLCDELGNGIDPQALLDKAWIVSIKNYIYSSRQGENKELEKKDFTLDQMMKIVNNARDSGARLVICAGMPSLEQFNALVIQGVFFICKKVPNATLKDLMAKVKDGVIVSGGEGLFAESLASPQENYTASILAGRYTFQYEEIANALASMWELETIKPDGGDLSSKLNIIKNYGVVRYGKTKESQIYFYCTGERFVRIISNGFDKELYDLEFLLYYYNTDEGIEDRTLYYSPCLSALYLPLHLNGQHKMEMPKVFAGNINAVLDIYRILKDDFAEDSWFKLIDAPRPRL